METTKTTEATIFISAAFGITKIEGKVIEFGTRQYAQYTNAPFVKFIRKGKRKPEGIIQGYNPYIVILKGNVSINPADPFSSPKISNGLVTKTTRMTCFDDGYKNEFDSLINDTLKSNPDLVLMDYRATQKTEIINL